MAWQSADRNQSARQRGLDPDESATQCLRELRTAETHAPIRMPAPVKNLPAERRAVSALCHETPQCALCRRRLESKAPPEHPLDTTRTAVSDSGGFQCGR